MKRAMRFGIEWNPRDIWVGLYIGNEKYPRDGGCSRKFFVCLIPAVVFIIEYKYDR